MGSLEQPYPRLLRALRWKIMPVPFYFRVFRGARFIGEMPALRAKRAATLGRAVPFLADAGFALLHRFRGGPGKAPQGLQAVHSFTMAETSVWERIGKALTFGVQRDSDTLNSRYVSTPGDFVLGSFAGGFVLLKVCSFLNHHYFGSLRVAVWVDGLAEPGAESGMLGAVEKLAIKAGADLAITNQLYAPIRQALGRGGWLSYASNFMVAWSPALARVLDPDTCHVTRHDGDGLVHF